MALSAVVFVEDTVAERLISSRLIHTSISFALLFVFQKLNLETVLVMDRRLAAENHQRDKTSQSLEMYL